ncbi:hypothetical protein M413DRAFT_25067 [Hebeloma cylindrosporum]|uniref:Aminotransferase class III n=1 Tax=Hebeloma cylindrosporum TaxID=76867 RepID=A0A0C3C6Y8_HEBCY|nr:hypothetical protein M413DRAFT_25067 [Hebeloma cylindrosporum h7]
MSPGLAADSAQQSHSFNALKDSKTLKPTSILHRTPWQPPIALAAEGIYIDLEDGRRVIDGVGGAAVACLGNSHPAVMQAIKDQVDKVSYVYNMQLSNQPAEALAKRLVDTSNGAFALCGFASGGSEAMESVLKLARQTIVIPWKYAWDIVFSVSSYSARSYADILDDVHFHHVSPAYAKRFQRADENEEQYVERLRQELEDKFLQLGPDTVVGFVAETVVGATTGVVSAPKGYFRAMKSVCDKYGALFILDEVMSGMGRMGTLHAWESFGDNVAPDIQAVAKGLGGGYASIGAILMSQKIADGIRDHSENIRKQGAYLDKLLQQRLTGPNKLAAPYIFDIRGGGGFWAVEFELGTAGFKGDSFAMLVQARALDNGLIVMGMTGGANLEGTKGDHVMLSPAYNVTKEQIEKIADIFSQSVEEVLKEYNVQ